MAYSFVFYRVKSYDESIIKRFILQNYTRRNIFFFFFFYKRTIDVRMRKVLKTKSKLEIIVIIIYTYISRRKKLALVRVIVYGRKRSFELQITLVDVFVSCVLLSVSTAVGFYKEKSGKKKEKSWR